MLASLLAAANPMTHVVDHTWWKIGPGGPTEGVTVLSNHIIMMIIAAVLLVIFIPRFAQIPEKGDEVQRLTPRGGRNFVETICDFLREFVARPYLGEYTDRFIVYIWSCFFFIATCNLVGLLPLEPITKPMAKLFGFEHGIYGTPTGNIFVTAALATCTFLMTVLNGLRLHGMDYIKHFFMGPFPINIFIAFLEVFGLLAKCAALAIRLFANMVAGHMLLAILISFIAMAGAASVYLGGLVTVFVVLGSVAIMLLEIFVAFLQAFIFTFLSAVFIGMAVNIHADHEHAEGEETDMPVEA
jgi:F-type H+-transporting ATPase subunit a